MVNTRRVERLWHIQRAGGVHRSGCACKNAGVTVLDGTIGARQAAPLYNQAATAFTNYPIFAPTQCGSTMHSMWQQNAINGSTIHSKWQHNALNVVAINAINEFKSFNVILSISITFIALGTFIENFSDKNRYENLKRLE